MKFIQKWVVYPICELQHHSQALPTIYEAL